MPETQLPPFDFHIPVDNLPMAFGTRLDNIPVAECYLPAPDADRLQAWKNRLGAQERLRVGLVWSGNPKHTNDHNRSMPLQMMSRLLDVDPGDHLAAALGRPTWILLPSNPDFRWMLNREDSPWYPTVRLFRQSRTRDYGSVIERVRSELAATVETWKAGK